MLVKQGSDTVGELGLASDFDGICLLMSLDDVDARRPIRKVVGVLLQHAGKGV